MSIPIGEQCESLYIVQNETHLKNSILLCASPESSIFIILDRMCGYSLSNDDISLIPCRWYRLDVGLSGFYRGGAISRIRILLALIASGEYKNIRVHKKIVIGSDGAIQRLLIRHYGGKKGIFVECWADGLLEKVQLGFFRRFLALVRPIAHGLKADCFMPSVVCTSKDIDQIYAMSESCKESLVFNGVSSRKITVIEFPRISQLKLLKRKHDRKRVLLVLSAFAWHGRQDIEDWEESVVELFSAQTWNDFDFSIRPHPRSTEKVVNAVIRSGYASAYQDCEEDIVNSDVVISYASTCLFDAQQAGSFVLVYQEKAPYINRGEFVEGLEVLKSLSDLPEYIG